nr:ankyrin repeat and protein kinase domain-containing protein 1-like [Lytechinus pictus]
MVLMSKRKARVVKPNYQAASRKNSEPAIPIESLKVNLTKGGTDDFGVKRYFLAAPRGKSVKSIENLRVSKTKKDVDDFQFNQYSLAVTRGISVNIDNLRSTLVEEDTEDYSPLLTAVRNCQIAEVHRLVSQGADVNQGNAEGKTPLMIAAMSGRVEMLVYLIDLGAEVNKGDDDGVTALSFAAANGHLDVVKYLISQGAMAETGNNEGWTALHIAARNNNLDVVKYLFSQGAEDIHLAIQHGHTTAIERLVSQGADLNVQSADGQMCLHEAIKLCYNTERNVDESDTLRKVIHISIPSY